MLIVILLRVICLVILYSFVLMSVVLMSVILVSAFSRVQTLQLICAARRKAPTEIKPLFKSLFKCLVGYFFEASKECSKFSMAGALKLFHFGNSNGKESTINRALGGSTYPV